MWIKNIAVMSLAPVALIIAACGSSTAGGDTTGSSGGTGSGSTGAGGGSTGGACTATVVIGRYHTSDCTPGQEVGTVMLDIANACDTWSRAGMNGTTVTDSFTRFQCYADRFCYTVHPSNATCTRGSQDTDVQLMAGECKQDAPLPDGTMINNFSKILSGLGGCPAAPSGYSCPMSAPGNGTEGVKAACGS